MPEDDEQYRRSVRNMLLVLAAVVLTITAALVVSPLVSPVHEQFNSSASVASPYGFTLSVMLNATQLTSAQGLTVTGWMNSTYNQVGNLSAANRWQLGPQGLWTRICTNGWPLGVGVLAGYYTTENFSLGSLVRVPDPLTGCPVSKHAPIYFLLQPHGSIAIVKLDGALAEWDLRTTLGLNGVWLGPQRGGVYTAMVADEWGDVALTHFRVSP
jgi:hypothetical protein